MIGPRRPGRPRKQPGGRAKSAAVWTPDSTNADIDLDAGVAAAVEESVELETPIALEIAEIADREERAKQLSQLLRSLTATGAERVAAARLLESMDRASSGTEGDEAGPPAPTTRAEQVVRLVKVLACAGADVRIEALTIIANRSGEQRTRILEMARQVSVPLTMPTTVAPSAVAGAPAGAPAATLAPTMLPLPTLMPLEEFHERTKFSE